MMKLWHAITVFKIVVPFSHDFVGLQMLHKNERCSYTVSRNCIERAALSCCLWSLQNSRENVTCFRSFWSLRSLGLYFRPSLSTATNCCYSRWPLWRWGEIGNCFSFLGGGGLICQQSQAFSRFLKCWEQKVRESAYKMKNVALLEIQVWMLKSHFNVVFQWNVLVFLF